jgi:hypothetical protein
MQKIIIGVQMHPKTMITPPFGGPMSLWLPLVGGLDSIPGWSSKSMFSIPIVENVQLNAYFECPGLTDRWD